MIAGPLPTPDPIADRACQIHSSAIVFDTHVDTPQRLLFQHLDLGKRDLEGCIDIPRMRQGNVGAIFFALWVPVEVTGPPATNRVLNLLDAVLAHVRRHPDDLILARTASEIRAAHAQGKIAILLGVEGGHAISDSIEVLRDFSARGVRYMTLTHNAATDWADSSNAAPKHNGLTDFGRQVIQEMNRLGMIVDVSHVSDKTFFDVIETSSAPVIASHSCCRSLCESPRNMTDEMIKVLASRRGVIQIAFHVSFLSREYWTARRALDAEISAGEKEIEEKFADNPARVLIELQKLSDRYIASGKLPPVSWEKIIDHIDHAVSLVGRDHVGIGSDFDGAYMPAGMEDASQLPRITEGLLRRGYSEADVRKVLGENTLRVITEVENLARKI
jgi:membrane dipeptidase